MDDLHPPAAPSRGRLEDHGESDLLRNPKPLLFLRNRSVAAGNGRHLDLAHRATSLDLVAHQTDRFRRRPDELHAVILADFRERRVFREESVPGVDRVRVGDLDRAQDRGDVEVALRARRRPHADGLVRHPHVHGVLVHRGIDGDGPDPHLAAGSNDADRDLSPVGDEHLVNHAVPYSGEMWNSGWP